MTVVCFASLKGAPGVTTLTCLVGATWPGPRRVMVVECDPSGGDLAARFRLSSKRGWTTFGPAARRDPSLVQLGSHLQQLPGGLDVLVGTRGGDSSVVAGSVASLLLSAEDSSDGPWDVLIDLGRLITEDRSAAICLDLADRVVIGLRSDVASVTQVREKAPAALERWMDRAGLVVISSGCYSSADIEEFTGMPVLGELPFDPLAAAVAAGEKNGGRRLRRSGVVSSAQRLASVLAATGAVPDDRASEGSAECRRARVVPELSVAVEAAPEAVGSQASNGSGH